MKRLLLYFCLWLSIAPFVSAQTISETPTKTFQRKGFSVMQVAISPDNKKLAIGGADGKIIIWDIETELEEKVLTGHGGIITCLQFTSNGQSLLSASKDQTIKLYDLNAGILLTTFSGHSGTVTKAWLNEQTNQVVSVSSDRSVRYWDKNTGKITKQFPAQPKELTGFWTSEDGRYVYLSSSDMSVKQMDISTGEYVRTITKHTSIIRDMQPSFDAGFFAISGDDPSITIVNTISGLPFKTLKGHKGFVKSIALSGDDQYLVSGGSDKLVKIWKIESGAEIAELPKQPESITSIVFSPDGKRLATADLSDKVKLWDVTSLSIGENKHARAAAPISNIASLSNKSREEKSELTKKETNISSSKTETLDFDPAKSVNSGKYYALIIAVQDYQDPTINDLDKPAGDAQRILTTLQTYYTFEKENTTFMKNPNRDDIVKALDKLSKTVTEFDNLLIFYAGHGVWDEQFKKGYWLPADAEKDNRAYWFSNSDLKDYIGGIKSKHTLLIADACFSGGIFKTRDAFANASKSIKQFYELPSRKAMTSGALKTVPDESVFVKFMLKRLEENKDPFFASEALFSSFRTAVINNSANGQVPQYGEIRETGDEGGDFIFIKRK